MKFGVRRPSLRGRISARTSWKRHVRHSLGFKAPRGYGWLTNPKKALYNRVYNRTTISIDSLFKVPRKTRSPQPAPSASDLRAIVPSGMGPMGYLIVAILVCGPTFFLLHFGFSVTWSILIPIIVVVGALWGQYIVLIGQAMIALAVLYFIVSIFFH